MKIMGEYKAFRTFCQVSKNDFNEHFDFAPKTNVVSLSPKLPMDELENYMVGYVQGTIQGIYDSAGFDAVVTLSRNVEVNEFHVKKRMHEFNTDATVARLYIGLHSLIRKVLQTILLTNKLEVST